MLDQIERTIAAEGYSAVGRHEAYYGTVLIAEKQVGVSWKVMWLCRDPLNVYLPDGKQRVMRQVLDINAGFDQQARINAAIEASERAQQDNARFIPALGAKEFDAIAQ